MSRYGEKIARMRSGVDTRRDFILADAKDADMAGGISAMGARRDGLPGYRARADYLEDIKAVVRQDIVDIMLVSASNLEKLLDEGVFSGSNIQPAIRANDTSDLWRGRNASYSIQHSIPFRSASLARAQAGLGLYSMTFNGDAEHDVRTLEHFKIFREEALECGFSYFLEVFNPNEGRIAREDAGLFVNDMIARGLAGLRREERPAFLKVAFNGQDALSELCAYDPKMVVGIMGGSSGTTRDCFELLAQAQRCGARAALFGRKIVDAEDSLLLVQAMRLVTDGELSPLEATHFYHDGLARRLGGALYRSEVDLQITDPVLQ
ncbi:hypothetical protein ABUE34_01265 [Kozakia baliensis]|uniref:hypothetical protein n=1 Tax=Kozakia baliensis TaxID=153496 RepID=UPI00345BBC22